MPLTWLAFQERYYVAHASPFKVTVYETMLGQAVVTFTQDEQFLYALKMPSVAAAKAEAERRLSARTDQP